LHASLYSNSIRKRIGARLRMKKIKVASLFSGCGGMDLGFVGGFDYRQFSLPKTGFEIVFA
jgi:DNA (cytosine-5)-methyltransferase 1